jgi:hypothetical protein
MQVADSENLRKQWGSKSCSHRNVEKEHYGEIPTGQYACTVCGRTFWQGDDPSGKQPLSPGN